MAIYFTRERNDSDATTKCFELLQSLIEILSISLAKILAFEKYARGRGIFLKLFNFDGKLILSFALRSGTNGNTDDADQADLRGFFLRKSGYSTALWVKYDLFMWFDDLKRRFYGIRVSGQS